MEAKSFEELVADKLKVRANSAYRLATRFAVSGGVFGLVGLLTLGTMAGVAFFMVAAAYGFAATAFGVGSMMCRLEADKFKFAREAREEIAAAQAKRAEEARKAGS